MDGFNDVSKDRTGLLNASSLRSGLAFNLSTYRSLSPIGSDSSCKSSRAKDTVHYLSPATTPAVTELEGDLYYQHFVDFQPPLGPPQPDYASSSESTISCKEPELQRTLAIIKPEAIQFRDVVVRAIYESGIKILNERVIHLTPEQVSEIYAKQYGSPSFPHVVISMSISPLLVMSLAGKRVIDKWKTMVGPYGLIREEWFFPYSVRTRFGITSDIPDIIHASENLSEAKWENRYFFPRSILEPIVIDEEKVSDYINNCITPILMEGLIQVVKNKPIDPVLFLAEWLLLNNPYQPKFPERVAVSPL
ncbi:nucleoside diphosphate kinase homolog 5-like [Diorhabda carinulata]|uniref:nucleoside diphosphate kinase homolog 5-like n=1 Tax=Diorhabda carinulata TaxID=1163345 RepID=UPI0025A0E0C5|nr:nucleoside diphosphate kinase homolog 5-like [Diorhabda carinulata]